jgi:carboxylesterase
MSSQIGSSHPDTHSNQLALHPGELGPVLAGAEPGLWVGTNGAGALVLHGFTGSPQSMRPLAQALAEAGFTVSMPRLPGHGTSVADMQLTWWADWSAYASAQFDELAATVDKVVVVGLSMGGTLTAHLAIERGEAVAGIALINAAVKPADQSFVDMIQGAIDSGVAVMPAIGGSIAKEGVVELAYSETPMACLLSMLHAGPALAEGLASVRCPAIVLTSPKDPVVPADASDFFCETTGGPIERVMLENSLHVATLDNDAPLVESSVVAFAQRVCGLS